MRETILSKLGNWGFTRLTLAVWIIASALVGFAGPFGSFSEHPLATRVLYWFVLIGLSIIVANGVRGFFIALGTKIGSVPFLVAMPITFGVIFAPVIVVTRNALQPPSADAGGVWYLFFLSSIIFAAVLTTRRMLGLDQPQHETPPRLFQRMPDHLGRSIARLSVDDHYVIVYFEDGTQERLLMRFTDAVIEMEPVRGLCVHRSHWVARPMIKHVETTKGREILCLTDGTRLPVGPKYRGGLKNLGVL